MADAKKTKVVVRIVNPIYEGGKNHFPGDIVIMFQDRADALGSSVEVAADKRLISVRGEDVICDRQ